MIGTMPARTTHPRRRCALVAALAALAGGLTGCAGGSGHTAAPPTQADALSAPVVRGVEAGLEARLWVVENRSGVLAGALRDYPAPAAADPAELETWRRNGFRVLEVPLEDLETVLAGLPTIGPRHREWLGLLPEWVEAVKGAQLAGQQPVRLDSGPVMLGPGGLRLVTRCWTTPAPGPISGDQAAGPAALLHIEVMPELVGPRRAERDEIARLLDGGVAPRSGVRGMAFDRLRLSLTASGGSALVIVPEDPEVDWRADAEGRPESGLDPDAARALVGPRMPKAPTLGELMLTSLALPESVGDARVVVVLVPRVPERFNLLPR
jgi:hypothetical protein